MERIARWEDKILNSILKDSWLWLRIGVICLFRLLELCAIDWYRYNCARYTFCTFVQRIIPLVTIWISTFHFIPKKKLDTFNTLTATRVSDEILFQATWCATVAKHILLGTPIDILLTRVAITRKNNLPRYLFSSLHELRFLTCYFCHHFTRTVRTFVE